MNASPTGVWRDGSPALGEQASHRSEKVDAFVAAAFAAFEEVYERGGVEERFLIAGRSVAVRFAGNELRSRFLPTLRHLAPGGSDAGLTICCWDGATSRVELPSPPWKLSDFLLEGRIRGLISGPLIGNFDANAGLFQLLDRRFCRALFHVGDARNLPAWHDRSPFRLFLSHWVDDEGLALMHGAAVADHGAAVLAGLSGSGKSTTALACVLAGMGFLADDACVVDPRLPAVFSLYGRAKLEADARRRLDGGGGLSGIGAVELRDQQETAVLAPRVVIRQAPLRAVLLLDVGNAPSSRLSPPLGSAEALGPLMATVRVENHGLTPAAIAALTAVAEAVPVRRLTVGSDRDGVIAAVREAIR